jgi:murein endopeptidase
MRNPLKLSIVALAAAITLALLALARASDVPDIPSRSGFSLYAKVNPHLDAIVDRARSSAPRRPRIQWRDSVAIGTPAAGRLDRGVQLPAAGPGYFTWDPVLQRRPNRDWRRWGTDELVRTVLRVLREYHRRHPDAPRVGIGDLSLPEGGYFGAEVSGGIGHATHQNGLDVDVYYPRLDRRLRAPRRPDQVDVARSQTLLDLFVDADATVIYTGPSLPLTGPPEVIEPLVNHDNHLHVRIAG